MVSVLMFIPGSGIGSAATQATTVSVAASRATVEPAGDLLTPTEVRADVASTYLHLGSGGVATSSFAAVQNVASLTYTAFNQLSTVSAFQSAFDTFGASSFILGFGLSGDGITTAYYGFDWHAAGQASTTYWRLNLPSELMTGPLTQSAPAAYHSLSYSTNWAGWEYWGPNTPALGNNQADEKVPTISVPSQSPANVPSGIYVHAVATAWLSVTHSQGGSNGLLQLGFSTDASQTSWNNYNMWYEYFLSSTPCPSYNFPGTPQTAPGHYMWESINVQSNGSWNLLAWDYNSHVGGSVYLSSGYCGLTSSWRPYYAEYIVEAYSYDENGQLIIQQIAKLSSQVAFYDQEFCTYAPGSCTGYTTSSSGVGSQIYQLAQSQASIFGYGTCGWFCNWDDNTNQVYNSGCGGFFGTCGYPTVSWVTSDFDYNIAH